MLGVNAETKALKKVHSRLYSSTPQDHTAGIMLILDDSTKTFYHLLLMPFKKKKKVSCTISDNGSFSLVNYTEILQLWFLEKY